MEIPDNYQSFYINEQNHDHNENNNNNNNNETNESDNDYIHMVDDEINDNTKCCNCYYYCCFWCDFCGSHCNNGNIDFSDGDMCYTRRQCSIFVNRLRILCDIICIIIGIIGLITCYSIKENQLPFIFSTIMYFIILFVANIFFFWKYGRNKYIKKIIRCMGGFLVAILLSLLFVCCYMFTTKYYTLNDSIPRYLLFIYTGASFFLVFLNIKYDQLI